MGTNYWPPQPPQPGPNDPTVQKGFPGADDPTVQGSASLPLPPHSHGQPPRWPYQTTPATPAQPQPAAPPIRLSVPPAPQRRSAGMIVAIVTGVVLACCLLSLIVASTISRSISTISVHTSETQTAQALRGPAHVGDTLIVNGVACTLVSVKTVKGDLFIKPKTGNVFVVVHVKLVNHSTQNAGYNAFNFHIRSSAGDVRDPEYIYPSTYTANDRLDGGTLTPGGSVEGDIIIQAPQGDHGAELTWQPAFLGSITQNVWLLSL